MPCSCSMLAIGFRPGFAVRISRVPVPAAIRVLFLAGVDAVSGVHRGAMATARVRPAVSRLEAIVLKRVCRDRPTIAPPAFALDESALGIVSKTLTEGAVV